MPEEDAGTRRDPSCPDQGEQSAGCTTGVDRVEQNAFAACERRDGLQLERAGDSVSCASEAIVDKDVVGSQSNGPIDLLSRTAGELSHVLAEGQGRLVDANAQDPRGDTE